MHSVALKRHYSLRHLMAGHYFCFMHAYYTKCLFVYEKLLIFAHYHNRFCLLIILRVTENDNCGVQSKIVIRGNTFKVLYMFD